MIRPMAAWPVSIVLVVVLVVVPMVALAADPVVVSVWGGNWKDTDHQRQGGLDADRDSR